MRWAVRGGIAVVAGIALWWGLTGNGNALDYPRCQLRHLPRRDRHK